MSRRVPLRDHRSPMDGPTDHKHPDLLRIVLFCGVGYLAVLTVYVLVAR